MNYREGKEDREGKDGKANRYFGTIGYNFLTERSEVITSITSLLSKGC